MFSCEIFGPVPGQDGEAGPTGEVGDKGDKGPTGDQGALNSVVSAWTEIKSSDWRLGQDGKTYIYVKSEPFLTQNNVDKALILSYYKPLPENEFNAVIALPDQTSVTMFTFSAAQGFLYFMVYPFENKTINPEHWNVKVRHIIIPPSPSGRLKNINWSDYNQVKKLLNLKD